MTNQETIDIARLMGRWNIELSTTVKRTEGPDGVRDWFLRFVWMAKDRSARTGPSLLQCDWEGFDTAEECLKDLVETLDAHIKPTP